MGYAGGQEEWPTYKKIKDHTEAVRIVFDATIISYDDILQHFVKEGGVSFSPSWGKQYRSALLVHNAEQRRSAEAMLSRLEERHNGRSVYVDVEYSTDFYRAEEYHQKFTEKQMQKRSFY